MRAAFADAKANVKVLGSEPADWSKDKGMTVMQDMLTRFPKIDALFSQDDGMAMGALQAMKAADRTDIKIYSVGAMKEACSAIKNKDQFVATAMQPSYLIGVYTVRAAYDALHGRLLPKETLTPTAAITADNEAQWESQCW